MRGSDAAAALDRVDRPVFAVDTGWQVTYANEAARRLLADGERLVDRVLWDVVPGVMDTDVPETLYAAARDREEDSTVVALADDRRVQFRAFPDETAMTVVVEDVTDRYRQVRRYEAVFDASVDPVCVVGETGRLEDVNEAAVEMTGYDRAALVGERGDVVFENFHRLRRRADRIAAADGADGDAESASDADGEVEATIRTAAGTRRLCSVGVAPLEAGFVVVVRDVTDRRSREQRVAVFDRVLRHNIRNEMNVIIGRAEAAAADADPAVADHVERIRETAHDLVAVSRDVRRFADAIDPEAGSARPRDAVELVQDAVDAVTTRRPGADVQVVVRQPVGVRAFQSVRAAIEELVENGIVHADRATPRVTVTVDADGDHGVVRVADRGPGLPETERRVLTEGGETQLDHASGVGLWLVNWSVTKSGGELSFEPNHPEGSVVTVRLPTAPAASETGTAASDEDAGHGADGTPAVDD